MAPRFSPEESRLLNPAFMGLLVARAAHGFKKETNQNLPFVYSFLIAPLVLHGETRERLPATVVTRLVGWTERNGDLITLLPRRMSDVAPATRRGILLAATTSIVRLGVAANIEPLIAEKSLAKFSNDSVSEELNSILAKAAFVGRWLATSGLPSTVLTTFGVRL